MTVMGRKKIIEVKLNNIRYATNFPVTINKNKIISFLTQVLPFPVCQKHVLINCIPNQHLIQTHMYKVNGAEGNNLGPL